MRTTMLEFTDEEAADFDAAIAEDQAAIDAAAAAIAENPKAPVLPHLLEAVLAGTRLTFDGWVRKRFAQDTTAGVRRARAAARKASVAEKFERLTGEDQAAVLAIVNKVRAGAEDVLK